jgi:prevent-host-death family protein
MKASIVDLRYRMKDVLRAIDRGEEVTVLYRGKEKARVVPIAPGTPAVRTEDTAMFGIWKDREDMKDPAAYVRKLREPRFESTFADTPAPRKKKRTATGRKTQ